MDLKFRILIFVLQLHIAVSYKSCESLFRLSLICDDKRCKMFPLSRLVSDKFNKLCTTSKFRAFVDTLLDDKPNVELENSNDSSAALISQKWDDKTYKSVEHCQFNVIAKIPRFGAPRGIFASIRQMNLRKGPLNECIDYVLFEVGGGEDQKTKKICGSIEDDKVYDVSNFFEAPGGTMKVVIFINRYVTLESGKELGIEFSFTSYDGNGEYDFEPIFVC